MSEPMLVSLAEAQRLLGIKAYNTLKEMIRNGTLAYVPGRPGPSLRGARVALSEIRRHIDSRTVRYPFATPA